jgi:hypothetical protein
MNDLLHALFAPWRFQGAVVRPAPWKDDPWRPLFGVLTAAIADNKEARNGHL